MHVYPFTLVLSLNTIPTGTVPFCEQSVGAKMAVSPIIVNALSDSVAEVVKLKNLERNRQATGIRVLEPHWETICGSLFQGNWKIKARNKFKAVWAICNCLNSEIYYNIIKFF